ncbi:MAG: class II fumarate hydratase [Oleiphilaceae bacterium]|nr:class II fumarate hydratase [Oleiphilaceae bacterium]
MKTRIEHDSMGEVRVPEKAWYQAQTQRALDNFGIQSHRNMPMPVIRALLDIKCAAAVSNAEQGKLSKEQAQAIRQAWQQTRDLDDQTLREHFPLSVFQTGSGTSSNMNANEVLATLATQHSKLVIHPNDHVNCSQSSNDVFPSALQIAVVRETDARLLPAMDALDQQLQILARAHADHVKTGRTHLMDAMPVTFGHTFGVWQQQLIAAKERVLKSREELLALPLGGTAVGTGVNASLAFAQGACRELEMLHTLPWRLLEMPGQHMSGQEASLAMAAAQKSLAVVLTRVANDLRWMNSGPICGLGEVQLPALQPGSSIMPAKVNPVIPEAVLMAMMDVMGNELAVSLAAQSGNFELNVSLPLIADKLLANIALCAESCDDLGSKVFQGLQINIDACHEQAARNPILVTALNENIGYEEAARIAKQALREGRTILEVAQEETQLPRQTLQVLLDPLNLARTRSKQKK